MQFLRKSARAVWGLPLGHKLACAIYVALCIYFFFYEGYTANTFFMMALAGVLIAAIALLTRRLLFATVFFAGLVITIAVTAWVKFEALTFSLHAWDFIYYWQSWSAVAQWWQGRPVAQAVVACGLLTMTIGAWLAWRFDRARLRRSISCLGGLAMACIAYGALYVRGERMHMQFNFPDWHVSNFLISFTETAEALWRGGLIEAARESGGKPFDPGWTCTPRSKPPHVILIHQESVGPPMFFPQINVDPIVPPMFNSFDGRLHKLNVETFGGASWLTESGVLLGLSSRFFGNMKDFVQFFMAGRLKESLPQVMAKCGYRNVMYYPYTFGVFGNKAFFTSIGLSEVFDRDAQGLQENYARDRVYYGNMVKEIAAHTARSDKPLFVFLETMSAHWPYDVTFEPDVKVPDGDAKLDPEIREYLRRLAMAKLDLDELKSELRTRFPNEQFLLLQYGDHHALPMSYLWGYDRFTGVQDMDLPKGYPLYTTYYAVEGINYTPPRLPAIDSIDTAFIGAVFLDAARIPLPESWRERLRLMELCEGKAFECKHRDEMLKFHRRLIDSGLISQK